MTLLDICITGEAAREWWLSTVKRFVEEYGFRNLQLDQIAHKCYVCYCKEHHHERPELAYTKELEELLQAVRSQIHAGCPEGVMVGEGMTDLTMQYCDGFWNWHQIDNKPEIVRYSVPWMNYSHETDALEFDVVNRCFAEKILLDLKIEGGDGILSDFPKFTEHLKKLSGLKARIGKPYIDGIYEFDDGIEYSPQEDVMIRVYTCDCADGREFDIVAANLTDHPAVFSFKITQPVAEGRYLYMDGREETVSGEQHQMRLQPYEVIVTEGVFIRSSSPEPAASRD